MFEITKANKNSVIIILIKNCHRHIPDMDCDLPPAFSLLLFSCDTVVTIVLQLELVDVILREDKE